MNNKITALKIEQVPCKSKGFREFKINYKYKGKNITDFRVFDDEIYHNQLDHELYRKVARETNKRNANGDLIKYANRFSLGYLH